MRRWLAVIVGVGLLALPAATLAQPEVELDETFSSDDAEISFDHPSDWEIEESEFAINAISDNYAVIILSPALMEANDTYITQGDQEERLGGGLVLGMAFAAAALEEDEQDLDFTETEEINFDSSRDGLQMSIETEDTLITIYSVAVDDDYTVVIALYPPTFLADVFEDELVQVMDTFSLETSGNNDDDEDNNQDDDRQSSSGDLEDAAEDGDPEGIIEVLLDEEIIEEGDFEFNEREVETDEDATLVPLGESRDDNLVMGATIALNDDDDDLFCGIAARITLDDDEEALETSLSAALNPSGFLSVLDIFGPEDSEEDGVEVDFEVDEPHHLMFVVVDDVANVYYDGELVLEEFELESSPSGSASFAMVMGRDCTVEDAFAYTW